MNQPTKSGDIIASSFVGISVLVILVQWCSVIVDRAMMNKESMVSALRCAVELAFEVADEQAIRSFAHSRAEQTMVGCRTQGLEQRSQAAG